MAQTTLSSLLDAVRDHVSDSPTREKILDAGRQLSTGANRSALRALAKVWGVSQYRAGTNRSTTDIRRDVEECVIQGARELLQMTEPVVPEFLLDPLHTASMVKAVASLDGLPAGKQVDELRTLF